MPGDSDTATDPCPRCHGLGEVLMECGLVRECPACNGAGEVDASAIADERDGLDADFDPEDQLEECPDCGNPVAEMELREYETDSGVLLQHLVCPDCGGDFSA